MDEETQQKVEQITIGGHGVDPLLLSALAILIGGWLLAVFARKLAVRIVAKHQVSSPAGEGTSLAATSPWVLAWLPRVIEFSIKAFCVVTFFHLLSQTRWLVPLSIVLDPLAAIMPKLISATVILVVACLAGTVLRQVTLGALLLVKTTKNIGIESATENSLREYVASFVFWLVLLFFLPAIVAPFGVPDLVEPLGNILDRIFGFAPNIVAAGAILLIGGFVAGILRRILANTLAGAGLDRLAERWSQTAGLGETKLSGLVAHIAYLFLLLAIGAAAIDALRLQTIYAPAGEMLAKITGFVPGLLAAIATLVVAAILGKILGSLVTDLLTAFGLNALWVRLGWAKEIAAPGQGPARLLGQIVFAATILLACSEAAGMVGLDVVPAVLTNLVVSGSHILFGLGIFAAGLVVARLAAEAVAASGSPRAGVLSTVTRVAIIVLAGTLALQAMNIANDVVKLGFGLVIGAMAVAFAIAVGFGGRSAASRVLDSWVDDRSGPHNSKG